MCRCVTRQHGSGSSGVSFSTRHWTRYQDQTILGRGWRGGSIIFEHRDHDWLGNACIQQVHQGIAFVSASNCSSPAHAPCHRQEQRLNIIITILGKGHCSEAHVYEFDVDAVTLFPGVHAGSSAEFQLRDVAQAPHSRQDLHKEPKRAHALHARIPARQE